jgi:hypothetical protein
MFRWYRDAAKCYVYLSDFSTDEYSTSSQLLCWSVWISLARWLFRDTGGEVTGYKNYGQCDIVPQHRELSKLI